MAGDEQIVYTDLTDSRLARLVKAAGDVPAQHALRLRAQAGPPAADAPRDVYLCHQFCELGAVLFSDVVDVLRRFLEEHPGEVLVIVIQDELAAEELTPVLEDGGLDPYLATIDPTVPLPTLGSMVESGRRLVIGLENGDLGPAIPNVYDGGLVQEVPYKYPSVAKLESAGLVPPESRPGRRAVVPAQPLGLATVARARGRGEQRGRAPRSCRAMLRGARSAGQPRRRRLLRERRPAGDRGRAERPTIPSGRGLRTSTRLTRKG